MKLGQAPKLGACPAVAESCTQPLLGMCGDVKRSLTLHRYKSHNKDRRINRQHGLMEIAH